MITIERIAHLEQSTIESLHTLLSACIDHGASLGFYAPAKAYELALYWKMVARDISNNQKLLYVLYDDNEIHATVQLALCQKQNARHRAEVEKLLVHPGSHRQGYASKLMAYVESDALQQGVQLLVLDTQSGDKAEQFYHSTGYTKVGQIPYYVSDTSGQLHSTSYYYKYLATNKSSLG
ncbi:GNAT family N-acetyltransferase [Pseudoalteromonas luteoviolacea]|uniref:GNAT family N-acetyltransferase n=1 Tax=Pseudoalteromonas luteoviolacea TaxID=43657 RepID=UPI0032B3830B